VEAKLKHNLQEEETNQVIIEKTVEKFVKAAKNADSSEKIAKEIHKILFDLYGLHLGDYKEVSELIYAHAALMILLSSLFSECTKENHSISSIPFHTKGTERKSAQQARYSPLGICT